MGDHAHRRTTDLLPEGTGLIIADQYDAEILRMGPEDKLPGARRKVMIQKFATHAARRLHALRDPDMRSDMGLGGY